MECPVVYHPFSTSNHNFRVLGFNCYLLSIILFLHQTTTVAEHGWVREGCLSSFFYIKPQREWFHFFFLLCCLSSFFYIKPQLQHQLPLCPLGCLSSFFYIKPQLSALGVVNGLVVYHPFSTSNHNKKAGIKLTEALSIILFLHQTTTVCLGSG